MEHAVSRLWLTALMILDTFFKCKLHKKTASRHILSGMAVFESRLNIPSVFDFDHGLLVVGAALSAYSVRHCQSAALTALDKSRSSHFPVCSPLIPMTSGRFILRADRHRYTSLPLYSHTKDIIRMPPPFVNININFILSARMSRVRSPAPRWSRSSKPELHCHPWRS